MKAFLFVASAVLAALAAAAFHAPWMILCGPIGLLLVVVLGRRNEAR